MNSAASYTYAVARAFDPARLASLRGIDGAAVHLVTQRELSAVVSALAPAAASRSAFESRLKSLTELEAIARAHHRVVDAVAACTVTLPLRLATIHKNDARVALMLGSRYRKLSKALARLAGRVELGIKLYLEPGTPTAPAIEPSRARALSPGRDYLRKRRQQTERQQRSVERLNSAARQVDRILAQLAVARREHPLQPPRSSPGRGENVLNVAYLVEAARVAEFIERARSLGTSEVSLTVTGPWAPYSFAESVERGALP
jgi:hypothetical protein